MYLGGNRSRSSLQKCLFILAGMRTLHSYSPILGEKGRSALTGARILYKFLFPPLECLIRIFRNWGKSKMLSFACASN